MMNRGSVFSGVLAVALWATLSTAEAKLVRYEINGQRYSYSTNNRQQVREARHRIQAAQQAAAERAANPLVRLFGSADPQQRDRGAGAGSTGARAAVPSHRPHQFGQEQPRRHSAESQVVPRAARGTGRSAPETFGPNASAPG